ncbi:serine hydrolase domain-containing protein [Actinoalloteichus hymeniacidonis]|uniref:Penicillin-binding protein, beta-lactamase class C n=1 Tax=Actinoalloteichus hymeniacidonis TaxID=340345 RepID=A0AAC9HTF4_9PSEU|nr:serine hydrolase domain-containing protein [Actinoalloteichus hymeniacidonis]AOS64611.1 penicillin-binding protein, beta-lactamase class C [Actinoalloteichus hymeniacidonis]MBB5907316.1 D-alanyl-D-alanine carboxypeptidase [Actinoalloteichus hymeniacidonis]
MFDHRQQQSRAVRRAAARRRGVATTVASIAAVACLASCGNAPWDWEQGSASDSGASQQDGALEQNDALQQDLDGVVDSLGVPAALASVRNSEGEVQDYTAGVGDIETDAPVPVDGQVRIGSSTKTFVAVVLMQLVAEGSVDLDASVETYLPGVVQGEGVDGNAITVRQLLQHTSGIPNFTAFMNPDFFATRDTYYEPTELLDLALAEPAAFEPGAKAEYSNTNYVIAGLIIEQVTGGTVAEEITSRVIEPAELTKTYFPAPRDKEIEGEHPKGYHPTAEDGSLGDITSIDPSMAWAAGQIVSTPSDVSRFYTALLAGDLVEAEQLAEMQTTVEASDLPGTEYGLGLMRNELSCGGVRWGHDGNFPGYSISNGATEDGRSAAIAVTSLPTSEEALSAGGELVDTALCGS